MLNNVRDFGAKGDGNADDRPGIQTAIDHAISNNKGGILFPPGIYRVSRVTVPGGRWSINLYGVQDFMVMGEGPKSVVKLVDTTTATGDWHVFILRNNCRRVVFKDIVIDGNRTGLTKPAEQSHGIEVEPGTEDLVIDRCILRECFGDGMRLLGAPGQNVKRLRIENSLFQTNKRSGLAIQRALEQIIITNCTFDATVTDQSIDIEPSGTDGPTELLIQGCIINHTNRTPAVTLSGISGPDPLVRCKFSDNITVKGTGKWKFGIRIAATSPHHVSHFSVIGNSIRGASKGVVFEGPGFRQTPVCALNRIADDVPSPFVGIGNLPFDSVVVGGVTSKGGTTAKSGAGRFVAGLGDPNNKVHGNVGDIFQRLDGAPGATLYVKETGNSTKTGWTAK